MDVIKSSKIITVPRKHYEYPNAEHPSNRLTGSRFPARFTKVMMGVGGGCGNPFERDAARVLNDVLSGYVSLESARCDYGVVLNERTWTVDEQATKLCAARVNHPSSSTLSQRE